MEGPFGRRRRGRLALLAVGIVCAGAIALEAILLVLPGGPAIPGSTHGPPSPIVAVSDVDLIASYATSNLTDTNYLQQTDCGCAPVDVVPGREFSWWVRLSNSDPMNHTVVSIRVNAPFVLVSTTPTSPVSLPSGQPETFTLQIQTPSTGGVYVVTGSVTVS